MWDELPAAEDHWLAEQLATNPEPTLDHLPAWSEADFMLLNLLLESGTLVTWSGEQVGKYLLVRDERLGQPVGVLAPTGRRKAPDPDTSGRLLRDLTNARRAARRWCVAESQRADGRLFVAAVSLMSAGQFLARARDWEAMRNASPDERARVVRQVRNWGLVESTSWPREEWQGKKEFLGNKLDRLYDWVGRSVLVSRAPGVAPAETACEVIMKPSGNDSWARRLLEQRSGGRISYRQPLFEEEKAGIALAGFLASQQQEDAHE
jgi:hypothetical protein